MKKTILILFVLVAIIGCDKKNEPVLTECQKENVGYLKFNNTSKNAYDVWINNKYYKQAPGNSVSTNWIKYPAGKSYQIRVIQVSGYIFYPTEKSYNITLNQCDEKTIKFP